VVKVSLVLCFVISLIYLPSANYPAVLYRSIILSHNSPGLAQLGLNTPNNFHSPVSVWPIISAATLGLALPSIIPSQMDCNLLDIPANLQAQPTITSPSYLPLLSPSSCHPTCVYPHHDPTILLVFIIYYSDTLYSVMFKLKLSVAHLYTAIPAQCHSCPRPLSPQ